VDLAQRRQQLRLKQVDAVKKFRQSNMSVSDATRKRKERDQMKKEVRKEIENETQSESIDIENSDGSLYAKVIDILGPTHMRPVVSNGVWKGTEQISEMNDQEEPQKEDPAIRAKQKRADQIKKQVLLKKLQAVRSGGGENIMASYEPSNWRADKNMRINKLMDR
tara:strand:+ start:656 stop:1150 length:495 start_codon:yes stop_codon:yes gene_type:complete